MDETNSQPEEITSVLDEQIVDRNLRLSIWEGASYSVMAGFFEVYFIPLLLALKASDFYVGLLSATLNLFLGFSQFVGLAIVETYRQRKRIMVSGGVAHTIVLFLMLLGVITGKLTPLTFIILGGIYFASVGSTIPAWVSIMGDVTANNGRGEYFGKRNSICQTVFFVCMLAAGGVLEYFDKLDHKFIGFAIVIAVGILGRAGSTFAYTQFIDIPYKKVKDAYFSFYEFLKRGTKSNFTKFVFFVALMNFSMQIAAPYFAAHMLNDLNFSYLQFSAATGVFFIAMIIATKRFGPLADRFGNRVIIITSGLLMPVFPLLWFISPSFWYILVLQMFNGVILSGWYLAGLNFTLDAVTSPKRARCTAYMNFTNSMCVCAGALIGATLSTHAADIINRVAPDMNIPYPVYFLFLLSSVCCILVLIFLLPKFHEVREVEDPDLREMLYMFVQFRPLHGIRFRFNPVLLPRVNKKNGERKE